MVGYKPIAFRPTGSSPLFRRQALSRSTRATLGQTFDQLFSWSSATGDMIRLLFHGATAALGYHVWIMDKGFWKYFGLLLGVGQTVGAICDVISLGQRVLGTHPPENES